MLSIKAAFRQVWKNKLFTFVNIIGLSVGLASVMALLIGVYMYATTDAMHKDKANMFYLKTKAKSGDTYMQTTYPLLGEIVKTCPEVEAGTHVQSWYYPWLKYGEKEAQGTTNYVDTGFFKVFNFPLLYGNAATAFNDKYSAVISADIAKQLFGNENPVGKIITADDTFHLTITGVLQPIPTNSSVRGDVFLTTALLGENAGFKSNADWYNGFALNFLRLRHGTDIKQFESKVNRLVAINYVPERRTDRIMAVPFSKMRDEAGPIVNIIISGSIGTSVFILLILLVNLINLNTAGLYNRSKEVAVRQIIGSGKLNIIKQFCLENAIIVFSSLILATLIFFNLLFPKINELYGSRFGEMSLNIKNDYAFLIFFIVLGILVTLLAGSLPAFKLISLKVSDAVKGRLSAGRSHRMRNIFIAVQFTLAIVFICITIILDRQIDHMKQASLGYNKDQLVVVDLDLAFKDPAAAEARFASIINDLKNNPYVKNISVNNVIPTAYQFNYNTYIDKTTNKEVNLRHVAADAGYFPTFEIPFIGGRNFNDTLAASEENSVIINRTAMQAFGWTSIDGKELSPKSSKQVFKVVGVVEDFHYTDMQQAVEPLLQWYSKQTLSTANYLSLRVDNAHRKEVLAKLEADFKSIPSRRNFKTTYMSDLVSKQYLLIEGISKTTNFVALLTIIISCMGMFGLISLFAKQRVKEIGVRKVLGAEVSQIVQLLSKDFIRLVIIACVVAFPIAWFVMHNWLQSFPYRISMQWWMFLLAGVIALFIAFVTVGFQAMKAALVNPVKSLRSE